MLKRTSLPSIKWWVLGPLIAVLGCIVALPGVFFQELQPGAIVGFFWAVPMIEESLKPSGVYFLLAKWPQALPNRYFTASLAGLAGLTFGLMENLLYLEVYYPDHSHEMMIFRYTVCLALHTTCSFIFGLGINQKLLAAVNGEIPLFSANKRFFITAMAIHGVYNFTAIMIEVFSS
jgi:RsiW-degrading membrane proteinase PrsW (M82 family)